ETCRRFFRGPGSNPQRLLFFEDALGVVVVLPIEWLESWEHLRSLISNRFESKMGHQKVLRGEYASEDEANGFEVTLLPWNKAIRPGRKINMAMKFRRVEEGSKAEDHVYICPGCHAVRSDAQDDQINLKCGMWMRSSRTRLEGYPQSVTSSDFSLTADEGSRENEDDPRHYHRVLFNIFVLSPPLPKETASPRTIPSLEECDSSKESPRKGERGPISRTDSPYLSKIVLSSHPMNRYARKIASSRRRVSSNSPTCPRNEYRYGWTYVSCLILKQISFLAKSNGVKCYCYSPEISMNEYGCLYCRHRRCLDCRVATVLVKKERRKA
ncbi:hypothetical protein CMEL01_04333, partial [Colletotrichum melonis]